MFLIKLFLMLTNKCLGVTKIWQYFLFLLLKGYIVVDNDFSIHKNVHQHLHESMQTKGGKTTVRHVLTLKIFEMLWRNGAICVKPHLKNHWAVSVACEEPSVSSLWCLKMSRNAHITITKSDFHVCVVVLHKGSIKKKKNIYFFFQPTSK